MLSFSNSRKQPFTRPSPHMWGSRLRFFFFFRFFSFPFEVFFSSSHLFEIFYVASVFQLGYIRVFFVVVFIVLAKPFFSSLCVVVVVSSFFFARVCVFVWSSS